MNSQWMWGSFPELMQLDSMSARWSLWHKSYGAIMKNPAYWMIAGTVQVGAQMIVGIPAKRLLRSFAWYNDVPAIVLPLVITLLMCLVIIWIFKRQIHRHLRLGLTARGLPTCIRCGYDLRGLPDETPRCPECGKRSEFQTRAD